MEYQYPIYCKLTASPLVVKFDGLGSGVVVLPNGVYSANWIPHTDQKTWVQLNPLQVASLELQNQTSHRTQHD